MHTVLHTQRLLLRPYTMDDVEAAYQVNLDPETSRYTGDRGVKSREEIREILQGRILTDYRLYGYGRFAVIYKATDRYIGFAGIKFLPEFGEPDIGYRFASEYWGQGLATEAGHATIDFAFGTLGLPRLIGLVLPENTASVRVLEKLGFAYEKTVETEGLQAAYYGLNRPG
ncbi:MAG: GNAT family N-acetyltransferase [Bacteroidota bacterium]